MDEEKETYSLWVEYLKRSKYFHDYCIFLKDCDQHDIIKNIEWDDYARLPFAASAASRYMATIDANFWANKAIDGNDNKLNKQSASISAKIERNKAAFRLYYVVFGDVFNGLFDNVWNNKIKNYIISTKSIITDSREKSVSLYDGDFFEEEAKYFSKQFHWNDTHSIGVNINNYIKFLSKHVIDPKDPCIALFVIDMSKSKSAILRSLSNYLDDNICQLREKNTLYKVYVVPTGVIYKIELKRYLRLYDLKTNLEKKTGREIFTEIYPDLKKLDAHEMGIGRARASKELGYAKKIIENVERGIFPGIYAKAKRGCDPDLK